MDDQISTPGLQIDEDIRFQRRFRIAQRAAWVAAGLVLIAALLGLFGSGLLTGAVAGNSETGLQLHYQRFARYQAPASLQIDVIVSDPAATETEFWIERASLNHYEVEGLTPESVEVAGDRLVYTFQIAQGIERMEQIRYAVLERNGAISIIPEQSG